MKNATATSQDSTRLRLAAVGAGVDLEREGKSRPCMREWLEDGLAIAVGQCHTRAIDKSALVVNVY